MLGFALSDPIYMSSLILEVERNLKGGEVNACDSGKFQITKLIFSHSMFFFFVCGGFHLIAIGTITNKEQQQMQ